MKLAHSWKKMCGMPRVWVCHGEWAKIALLRMRSLDICISLCTVGAEHTVGDLQLT